MCLCSVCCACTSHLAFAFSTCSHKVPQRRKSPHSMGQAEILPKTAEVASGLALTVPEGIR